MIRDVFSPNNSYTSLYNDVTNVVCVANANIIFYLVNPSASHPANFNIKLMPKIRKFQINCSTTFTRDRW